MNNVNNYIEKKQKKIVNDDDEDDKSSLSFVSANIIPKTSKKEKSDKNKEKVENKNNDKVDNEVPENKTHKKLKKKKKPVKNEDINHKFNLHFKKILEAGKQSKEDEQGKNELINEIQEKSQYLTLEGLKEYAKNKHIINIIKNSLNFSPISKSYKLVISFLSSPFLLMIFSPKNEKKKLPREIVLSIIPTTRPLCLLNHS